MFNRVLPTKCPPNDAVEMDKTLYRVFHNNIMDASEFIPYVDLEPDNVIYKNKCEAYAVSFYASGEAAYEAYKTALKREKLLGNYIAKLRIPGRLGLGQNNFKEHHRIWFYNQENISEIECEEIKSVELYERD